MKGKSLLHRSARSHFIPPVFSLLLILAGGLWCHPAKLAAQSGVLFVRVQGPTGPVYDATVELLFHGETMRRVTTDQEGVARMAGVPADTYDVRVESLGFRVEIVEGVGVASGSAQAITVTLETEPIEVKGLTITAERVQIQMENTEFATRVEEEALRLLPMTHDAMDIVALTPGARPGFVWGGASFQANNYRVDGLSANHPGLGGDLLNPSIHWIERIEVRGLGSGAEYGGFQGGLIDVVTKSGTNDFQGGIRTTMENDALSGSNLLSTEIGTEVVNRQDLEGEIRGPLLRDRLLYFLSGKYVSMDQTALNHLPQVEGRYTPFQESSTEGRVFGKLTWTHGPTHKIEVSGSYTNISADNFGITGYEAAGATHKYSAPTWFLNASAREVLGGWGILEARFNHFSLDQRYDPYGDTEVPGLSTFALTPPYTAYRNAPFSLRSAPSSTSATVLANLRATTGDLEHLLKIGVEYTSGGFLDRRIRNGGMTWAPVKWSGFDPEDPESWKQPATATNRIFSEWGGEVRLDADVSSMAAFAQSSISLGPRLVFSPGIRWTQWKGWLSPLSGSRFLAVEDAGLDPRVGLTVDLSPDGTLVAKAHWGRYHQKLMTQMFDRVAGANVFNNEEYWYYAGAPFTDPATTFSREERDALAHEGQFIKRGEIVLNETGPLQDYHQPYVDQWLIGLEKQVGNWLKVEALYTHRSNRNMVALVDQNRDTNFTLFKSVRVFDPSGAPVPFSGGSVYLPEFYLPNNLIVERLKCRANSSCPDALPIPGLSTNDIPNLTWDPSFVLTNAPDGKRDFSQVQLNIEVAGDEWGGSLSVVKTHLEGNLDNVSGYTDPMGFGAGPYVRVNEGVNSFGILENFADIEWKASVWGMLPWQLRGGLFWTLRSGDHYSPRFRLYGMGFFEYRVGTGAMTQSGEPEFPGQELDYKLMGPLEGHYIYLGPRGKPTLQRQSILDVRLERLFRTNNLLWGISLNVFNLFRDESITQLNTIANNGPEYGFRPSGSLFAPPLEPNQYYQAPMKRVKPQTLRLGLSVYF